MSLVAVLFIGFPLLSKGEILLCPITYPHTNFSMSDVELYAIEKGKFTSQEIEVPVKLKNGLAYTGWEITNDSSPKFWEEAICYYRSTKKAIHVKIPKQYIFCGVPTYNTPKTPLMTFECFTSKEYTSSFK